MPLKVSDDEFISCWKRLGSPAAICKALGLDIRGVYARRDRIERRLGIILDTHTEGHGGRAKVVVPKVGFKAIKERVTGTVIIFSDLHAWPGDQRTPAYDGLISLIKELKPSLIVANGDSMDNSSISRHPPINWEDTPSVMSEIEAVRERHAEIEAHAPEGTPLVWLWGNHCLRFNARLALAASEFKGVHGMSLEDHFPAWDFAMLLELNKKVIVRHNWHNGQHAGYNNVLKSGMTMITGHTHRLQMVQWQNMRTLEWGIECGTLADFSPESRQFNYAMGNSLNWSQGFVVLTFTQGGVLLEPEFCRVIEGTAYFRGNPVGAAILPAKQRKKNAA